MILHDHDASEFSQIYRSYQENPLIDIKVNFTTCSKGMLYAECLKRIFHPTNNLSCEQIYIESYNVDLFSGGNCKNLTRVNQVWISYLILIGSVDSCIT